MGSKSKFHKPSDKDGAVKAHATPSSIRPSSASKVLHAVWPCDDHCLLEDVERDMSHKSDDYFVYEADEDVVLGYDEAIAASRRSKTRVPDRLSVDPGMEYYDEDLINSAAEITVYFNGDKRPNDVREYCISEGWIRKHIVQKNGKIRMERGKPVTIKMRGDVRVEVQ